MDQNMKGYVIPTMGSLVWIALWILIIAKYLRGTLTTGRKGGWSSGTGGGGACCRIVLMFLCLFQSFYGFCVLHSMNQAVSLPLMVYPIVGFIAFSGNNPAWCLGYARTSFAPPPPARLAFFVLCGRHERCQLVLMSRALPLVIPSPSPFAGDPQFLPVRVVGLRDRQQRMEQPELHDPKRQRAVRLP